MSFEEFCASFWRADTRAALGISLTDAEAQQVLADPASAQNWYTYWLSTNPDPIVPPAPAIAPATPFAATTPIAETAPYPTAAPFAETAPYPSAAPQFAAYPGSAAPAAAGGFGPPPPRRRTGLWVSLSIVGALLLVLVVVAVAAFATARHWTKTDVPEQPETFHSEEYKTGRYDVSMDPTSPCWVDQDWTDCVNLMVSQYNAACADITLTEDATAVCADYLAEIDRMKSEDTGDYIVVSLGGYGSLHRTEETATRQVSNNDHRDAVTHEAVCYLGFIGECT